MRDQWIKIKENGNCWDSEEFYVHKSQEIAKVYRSKCVYCGYHDESEEETEESIISIENALKLVYPDKVAIYKILQYTKGDYSEVLEELFETKEYLSELSEIGLLLQKEEKG